MEARVLTSIFFCFARIIIENSSTRDALVLADTKRFALRQMVLKQRRYAEEAAAVEVRSMDALVPARGGYSDRSLIRSS